MPLPIAAGTQRVTADAVVGVSGAPTIVWRVEAVSGTTPTLDFKNGAAATDTAWAKQITTSNQDYGPSGLFFPAGCYADVDGTSPVYVVSYTTLATS